MLIINIFKNKLIKFENIFHPSYTALNIQTSLKKKKKKKKKKKINLFNFSVMLRLFFFFFLNTTFQIKKKTLHYTHRKFEDFKTSLNLECLLKKTSKHQQKIEIHYFKGFIVC